MLPTGYHSLHCTLIRKAWQQCASRAAFTLNSTRGSQITLFLQTLIGISDTSGFSLSLNKKLWFVSGTCNVCYTAGLMESNPSVHQTDGSVLVAGVIDASSYSAHFDIHTEIMRTHTHTHTKYILTPQQPGRTQQPFPQRLIVCFGHPQIAMEQLWH